MQLHSFTKGAEAELVGTAGWQWGQDGSIPKCGANEQSSGRHGVDCPAGLVSVPHPSLGPRPAAEENKQEGQPVTLSHLHLARARPPSCTPDRIGGTAAGGIGGVSPGTAAAQRGDAVPLEGRPVRPGLGWHEERGPPVPVTPAFPSPALSARPLPARCPPLKPPAGLPRPARAPRARSRRCVPTRPGPAGGRVARPGLGVKMIKGRGQRRSAAPV